MALDLTELRARANEVRGWVVEMSHRAGTPHLGSALSCVDVLVAAFWGGLSLEPETWLRPDRDRLILSKGHAATALYAVLAMKGYFPHEWLLSYADHGAPLGEHPSLGIPGIDVATGSLGHGLPVGLGLALSNRIRGFSQRVCILMSDGECNEGSVWEAAMLAPAHRLSQLSVVIDVNGWQATGRSAEITSLEPLAAKWAAFGWRAWDVDGHDLVELRARIAADPDPAGRPTAIIARTVKGKGVSFMEDDNNWHYRIPTSDEVAQARRELQLT